MISTSEVCTWLRDQLTDWPTVPVVPGTRMPEMPDVAVMVTLISGVGLTTEGAVDIPAVQVTARGPQENYDDIEHLVRDIDSALLAVNIPQNIGSTRVLFIDRVGGSPAPITGSPDGERVTFTCSYLISTIR